MTIIGRANVDILEGLHSNASLHAEQSDGFFITHPFNQRRIEAYQTLHTRGDTSNRRVVSEILPPQKLEQVADIIDPRYRTIDRAIAPGTDLDMAISNMATQLGSREHIFLAQRHGEIRDVAFHLGFTSCRLKELTPHKTALVVSKAIDFLSIDTRIFGMSDTVVDQFLGSINLSARTDRSVPLRDFLGIVANYLYFTIPSTETFSELRETHEAKIKRFNKSTTDLMEEDFISNPSPIVFGLAATGTTEKELDKSEYSEGREVKGIFETIPENPDIDSYENIRVLGTINPAVIKFMKHGHTYAGGIDLNDTSSSVDIRPKFVDVQELEDLERVVDHLRESLTILHPDTLFIQDLIGNLPKRR